MTLRLSTQSLYMQGLNSLLGRQSEIGRLQQQISSGVKLTQGKDDPVGMATAQRLEGGWAWTRTEPRSLRTSASV